MTEAKMQVRRIVWLPRVTWPKFAFVRVTSSVRQIFAQIVTHLSILLRLVNSQLNFDAFIRMGVNSVDGRTRSSTGSLLQRGFTLIEIMVVVIIIGILAATVAPKVFGRMGDAQITKAKGDIATLESAIDLYRMDNFVFPGNEYGLEALVKRPIDPSVKNWKDGGYIKRLPKDPWGNPYQYQFPGTNGEVDIFTYGRDGRPGGEKLDADIGNWDLD